MFGAKRYGPSAPLARQLGKYDSFTTTGTPTRSTAKDTSPCPSLMALTVTGGNGCDSVKGMKVPSPYVRVGFEVCTVTATRFQVGGPDAASGVGYRS